MKWTLKTLDNGCGYPADYWVDENEDIQRPVNFYNPSTNTDQAIDVMERIGSFRVELSRMDEGYEYLRYKAVAYNKECRITDNIYGKELPEAICKAALFIEYM